MIVAGDRKAQLYLLNNELKECGTYRGEPYKKNDESNKNQSSVKFDHFPWIKEIKFSPNGKNICYGTHGQSMYAEIVPVENNSFDSKNARSFTIGSSAVDHIDWSKKGGEIAINTQGW